MNKKTILSLVILISLATFLFFSKTKNIPFVGIDSGIDHIWSIGIYKLYNNNGFLKALPHPEVKNPILTAKNITDRKAEFVADPFIISEDGSCYMFFEVLDKDSGHGDIGLATSEDGIRWNYQQIVLDEPFHLSYPSVFKCGENYYMLPESGKDKSVRLYKADSFPYKWRFIKKLIEGKEFADPTIFYHGDKWWLFASDFTSNLYLYYADNLEGVWIEHSKSPIIVENANITRPGGNVIHIKEKLIRIAQDGYPHYGMSVRAFEITKLNMEEYEERELEESPLLEASGRGWNKDGMHQFSSCRINDREWIVSVDGKVRSKKYYFYVELPKALFEFLTRFAMGS